MPLSAGLTRRAAVAGLLGLIVAPAYAVPVLQGKRIIVIGAGLAGLAAARDLKKAGARRFRKAMKRNCRPSSMRSAT